MKKPVLQSSEMFPHVEAWMAGTLSQREYADQHNFFLTFFLIGSSAIVNSTQLRIKRGSYPFQYP
jgi:hypothetical protein